MNPKWRVLAKLWTCSTQIPVRVETSESVKIFWLDFTVTMALLLGSGPNFRSHFLGCYKHPICFYETRAIVVPFRPQNLSGRNFPAKFQKNGNFGRLFGPNS